MEKSGKKLSYCGLTYEELEDMPPQEREKYQIHIYQIALVGKKRWHFEEVWLDAPPRRPEKHWNFDKLGRSFTLGQVMIWFSSDSKYGLTEHAAFITSFFVDTGTYYAYSIKNEKYVASWEKTLANIGDAVIVDTRLEVDRLRQEHGALILGTLYNPWYSHNPDHFPPPHI